jgi:deazaflavin-dependent oxidoreductase (nitroreductase family)
MGATKLRLLKAVAKSGMWQAIGAVHAWVYRRSGGRLGHRLGRFSTLMLTTTGRRSGTPRTVPLTYLPDGHTYVIVASNGGADRAPAWWLNLRHTPHARIQVGRQTIEVSASEANADERRRLWPLLTAYNPVYASYTQITHRPIPVVILRPVD